MGQEFLTLVYNKIAIGILRQDLIPIKNLVP